MYVIVKIVNNSLMKKLLLIRNPELFQGEKYLIENKSYFEGWYFKNSNTKYSISFIPGISIDEHNKKAFIQIITNDKSYFIDYNIDEFNYSHNPFYIQIGNSFFSKEKVSVDIKDEKNDLRITGNIYYSDSTSIRKSFIQPNIMGPFSYIPNMECNHSILCMKSKTSGEIHINNVEMNLNQGTGYIEKDWGYSFPKSYIWCQGNDFKKSNASFMLSIADIPFKEITFKGIICVLIINGKEYRFTTYNNTKLIKNNVYSNLIDITIKKGRKYLELKSEYVSGNQLLAPVKGRMIKNIMESITSILDVSLRNENKIIFKDTSKNCGLEIY